MSTHPKAVRVFSFEQAAFALLLVVGLYLPTSADGEHSVTAIGVAFAILIGLLVYLAWRFGIRCEIAAFISLPIMMLPVSWTLWGLARGPVDVDLGLFLKFSALALILALDLQAFRPGGLLSSAFVLVNIINIAWGAVILIGSEWMTDFLPKYYWTAYTELVPLMVGLHNPVLTFGTHSLAGFFIYLFFWLNWEDFRHRGSKLALFFALSYFVLLLGLTSFTSFGFAALALAQMGMWSWKSKPRLVVVVGLCIFAIITMGIGAFPEQADNLKELPQLAGTSFLNTDLSGPLSRYGPEGSLRVAMTHLHDHPFLPIGFARSTSGFDVESPSHFFIGDSGTLEYLLRGSVPLLVLTYFGLYRFLRHNLSLRSYALLLFLVFIFFETAFELLTYFRTLYLLPFVVIHLNKIGLPHTIDHVRTTNLPRPWTLAGTYNVP